MKRIALPRETFARHEAGHQYIIACTPDLDAHECVWHRGPQYEISHTEPSVSSQFDWEKQGDRNAIIVKQVCVALAGGAAEACHASLDPENGSSIEKIYQLVGKVDFELAHEWLTLQRYDPEQCAIEQEIQRLFLELHRFLHSMDNRRNLALLEKRILDYLNDADTAGHNSLNIPYSDLLEGLNISQVAEFELRSTLYDRLI